MVLSFLALNIIYPTYQTKVSDTCTHTNTTHTHTHTLHMHTYKHTHIHTNTHTHTYTYNTHLEKFKSRATFNFCILWVCTNRLYYFRTLWVQGGYHSISSAKERLLCFTSFTKKVLSIKLPLNTIKIPPSQKKFNWLEKICI